jgi:hypothetical protein
MEYPIVYFTCAFLAIITGGFFILRKKDSDEKAKDDIEAGKTSIYVGLALFLAGFASFSVAKNIDDQVGIYFQAIIIAGYISVGAAIVFVRLKAAFLALVTIIIALCFIGLMAANILNLGITLK